MPFAIGVFGFLSARSVWTGDTRWSSKLPLGAPASPPSLSPASFSLSTITRRARPPAPPPPHEAADFHVTRFNSASSPREALSAAPVRLPARPFPSLSIYLSIVSLSPVDQFDHFILNLSSCFRYVCLIICLYIYVFIHEFVSPFK